MWRRGRARTLPIALRVFGITTSILALVRRRLRAGPTTVKLPLRRSVAILHTATLKEARPNAVKGLLVGVTFVLLPATLPVARAIVRLVVDTCGKTMVATVSLPPDIGLSKPLARQFLIGVTRQETGRRRPRPCRLRRLRITRCLRRPVVIAPTELAAPRNDALPRTVGATLVTVLLLERTT